VNGSKNILAENGSSHDRNTALTGLCVPRSWRGGRERWPTTRPTGVPRSLKQQPSQDPTVGLSLGSYGGPRGGGAFLMSEVPLQALRFE